MSTEMIFDRFHSKNIPKVDRLLVHQFDPSQPSPGGIDTCIRGLCKYLPSNQTLAIVGVAAGPGPNGRRIGRWESYNVAERKILFLPVTKLDPSIQSRRRVPHSLRLAAGLTRFVRRIPQASILQAHRADTSFAAKVVIKGDRFCYFIHTQDRGITSSASDSIWTRAAAAHERIEKHIIRAADSVVVFNEEYSKIVRRSNGRTIFSPTWFDPAVVKVRTASTNRRVVWVGRLEKPKDPMLAIGAFEALLDVEPHNTWTLTVIGSGLLAKEVEVLATRVNARSNGKIRLMGRLKPDEVAEEMSKSSSFLMTSQPGYEGYPRVLVESMATGLIPVVTDGSDTGGLVEDGVNGFITSRNPVEIADRLRSAEFIESRLALQTASSLAAPAVVSRIFQETS